MLTVTVATGVGTVDPTPVGTGTVVVSTGVVTVAVVPGSVAVGSGNIGSVGRRVAVLARPAVLGAAVGTWDRTEGTCAARVAASVAGRGPIRV